MQKILATIGLTIALLGMTAPLTCAAYQVDPSFRPDNSPFGLEDELGSDKKEGAINATNIVLQIIAGGLLYFAAPMAIIMIGLGAFNMVMYGSESEKVEEAKKHLTWSIVGLFVIILSYAIVKILITFVVVVAENS